jgi:hypothetical protein
MPANNPAGASPEALAKARRNARFGHARRWIARIPAKGPPLTAEQYAVLAEDLAEQSRLAEQARQVVAETAPEPTEEQLRRLAAIWPPRPNGGDGDGT